jgi:hypothetical protein
MESTGDEKKIRALFSELQVADEHTAPGFNAVWHRAQSRSLKPRRAFNLSFAVATALLICALASLAVWSKYSQPVRPVSAVANMSAPSDSFARRPDKSSQAGVTSTVKDIRPPVRIRVRRSASPQQVQEVAAYRQAAKDAKAIESWQSPTADLLSSPSDGLFKSLPTLNENANELKSFLPNRENDKEK